MSAFMQRGITAANTAATVSELRKLRKMAERSAEPCVYGPPIDGLTSSGRPVPAAGCLTHGVIVIDKAAHERNY